MVIGIATRSVCNRFILHVLRIPRSQTDKESLSVHLESNLYCLIVINAVKSFASPILNDSIKQNSLMIHNETCLIVMILILKQIELNQCFSLTRYCYSMKTIEYLGTYEENKIKTYGHWE